MNVKKYLLTTVLLTLAMHPPMLAILSPYMLWIVGLTWDQLVLWWWTGLFIGMLLNAVLAIFVGKVAPKIDAFIDRLLESEGLCSICGCAEKHHIRDQEGIDCYGGCHTERHYFKK